MIAKEAVNKRAWPPVEAVKNVEFNAEETANKAGMIAQEAASKVGLIAK